MLTINEKYCKTLELDKILQELSQFTCCEYAKEMALNIKPHSNLNYVRDNVLKTHDAFTLTSQFGTPSFSNLTDPTPLLKLANAGGLLSLRNYLNIAEVLRQVRILKEWYRQCENVQNSLKEQFSMLIPNKSLEDKITSIIISEDMIDDYASEELASIRKKIRSAQAKVKQSMERIISSNKYQKFLQDSLITMRDSRFVIPVKAEYKNEIPGLVHDTSSSGATLFIEPMAAVEANNEIRVLQIKEKAEIERILYELSALCAENKDSIISNFEMIMLLNLYFAKSHLAAKMNAMMPEIVDNGKIVLNKARHPLIDKHKVVPINVNLGGNYSTLVVTGPNTGGKTVTLKTLGLLTLMTMCGLLIPVSDESTICIFRQILVDIGDEQSIEHNLSTFSSHMTNIVSILEKADKQSLVLVDELGSGTDPVEGAAIAIAILEKLKEKGSVVAATTHYPELKVYAIETENVENACCEFDIKTLQPTYKLLIGVPGRSNAFAISRKLGLSEDILEFAQNRISEEDKKLEAVIDSLDKSRQDYEEKNEEYIKKLYEINNKHEVFARKEKEFEQQKDKLLDMARNDAKKIVEQVKSQSQEIMDELLEIKKSKDSEDFQKRTANARSMLKGKLNTLHSVANPVSERTNDNYVLPRKLKFGDTVLVVDINKNATVLEVNNKSDEVLLQVGIMKIRAKTQNLRLVENATSKKKQVGKTTRTIKKVTERSANTELDLRGLMVEEALMEVDMFIDQSIMSNLEQVTIIHGKGTGALRAAIHSHFRRQKHIKSFRLGTFGEGESGVTVVQLK